MVILTEPSMLKILILELMKFGEALKLFPERNGTGKRHMKKVNVTGKVHYTSALSFNNN